MIRNSHHYRGIGINKLFKRAEKKKEDENLETLSKNISKIIKEESKKPIDKMKKKKEKKKPINTHILLA